MELTCNKKTRAYIIGFIVLTLLITALMISQKIASADSGHYSYVTGLNGFASSTLSKSTTSKIEVHHYGQYGANIQVRSSGTAYSSMIYFPVGRQANITNSVVENGKHNCYLYITPVPAQNCMMYGDWMSDI